MTEGDKEADAEWCFEEGSFVECDGECERGKSREFPCHLVTGRHGYEMELAPKKRDNKGEWDVKNGAWSMNKGLIIEVIGAEKKESPYKRPCCQKYEESKGKITWDR